VRSVARRLPEPSVNDPRKRQRVIVENDGTLVVGQSAWLLSSL
jgi:hypothetical protein